MTSRVIHLSAPDIGEEEIRLVNEVLRSGQLACGPLLDEFERQFCERFGSRHAIGMSSGTAALHCALIAAGVGEGDLVVTTPFSFVASANVILYQRAIPIFVDIDPATLSIDPDAAANAISTLSSRTPGWRHLLPRHLDLEPRAVRAAIPVHVFGHPAELAPIVVSARSAAVAVVEDACEAIGAMADGVHAGRFGAAGVFAFYPNKQMTTGEGGMVITDDDEWARQLRSLRNQGRAESGAWLHHERLGFNYRLDELSAALGVAQMRRLDELLARRAAVAAAYSVRLAGMEGVTPLPPPRAGMTPSWFVYPVRLAAGIDRDAVMAGLARRGVMTRPYFTPIHLQPLYQERFGFRRGDFPASEAAGDSMLALPFHGRLSEEDIDCVADALEAEVRIARAGGRPSAASHVAAAPSATHHRKVLVFGAHDAARRIATAMIHGGTYQPLGFVVDDDSAANSSSFDGPAILGTRADLPNILAASPGREILVAIPQTEDDSTPRAHDARRENDVFDAGDTVGTIRSLEIEDLLPHAPIAFDRAALRRLIGGKRVMVTGAGGSIGSELCRHLSELGPDALIMYERHENSLHEAIVRLGSPVMEPIVGDIRDRARLDTIFRRYRPEIVFHTAAHKHVPLMEAQVCEAVKNNVLGTARVADVAERNGVRKFVLISSDKAVQPTSVMGATKLLAEMVMRGRPESTTEFITVRFGNVLLSNGSAAGRFVEQIHAGGPVTVTHPDASRFFLRISDAVRLLLGAAALGGNGAMYLLDMGAPMRIVDLARCLIRLHARNEVGIEFIGLRPGEKVSEDLVGAGERTSPTGMQRILRIEPDPLAPLRALDLSLLNEAAESGDDDQMLQLLRVAVPEFVPAGRSPQSTFAGIEDGTEAASTRGEPRL